MCPQLGWGNDANLEASKRFVRMNNPVRISHVIHPPTSNVENVTGRQLGADTHGAGEDLPILTILPTHVDSQLAGATFSITGQ